MNKKEKAAEEQAFELAFHGIPDSRSRSMMSPEKLAIELSNQKEGSPAYLLLEHELNLRLATIQANATRVAALYGVLGVILGAVLTAALGYFFK